MSQIRRETIEGSDNDKTYSNKNDRQFMIIDIGRDNTESELVMTRNVNDVSGFWMIPKLRCDCLGLL